MLFIIDVEATCWSSLEEKEKLDYPESEIIELGGAIITKTNGFDIITSFSEFIKPLRNQILSKYCTDLTSIKQKDINIADNFSISFPRFLKTAKNYMNNISFEEVIFASWGEYDKEQIKKDCKLFNIDYPFNKHWNIKWGFSKLFNTKKGYGVLKALKKLDITFKGVHHRGKDDAYNIANIIKIGFGDKWKEYISQQNKN